MRKTVKKMKDFWVAHTFLPWRNLAFKEDKFDFFVLQNAQIAAGASYSIRKNEIQLGPEYL